MTIKIITGHIAFLLIAFAFMGMSFVHASEVTGTLSSDASNNSSTDGNLDGTVSSNTQTDGSISGTVTGGSSGGSSSGGRRSSGGGSSNSSSPDGAVLGATTDNVPAPSFPNAGFGPEEITDTTLVSKTIAIFRALFKNAISF